MSDKLSIIIPYRDRKEHLNQFVPFMNSYLNTHLKNDFNIIIVEQANSNKFNRGSLINIGFDLEGRSRNPGAGRMHNAPKRQ